MKKSLVWLGVTLTGCAISFYGNKKVQQAVREEQQQRLAEQLAKASH
jgi:hypothetical protein